MIVPQVQGMGGELADAWKNLTSNVSAKANEMAGSASRVEIALKVAVVASVAAALLAGWVAWNTRRR